jgi:putative peptidoglycan lipid II flippase
MSFVRSIATVGGFTLLSRITGLMREMLIAHFLGAGMMADAFFVAFRFPNLFRSLFAEGALNAAFVPLFSGKLTSEGHDEAVRFAQQAFAVLGLTLALFVAVVELIMPLAMWGLAPGFAQIPGKIQLATDLSRICFPYLLFISLTALQAGVLNSVGRFAAAAGTPILLNLVAMLGLFALSPLTPTPAHALAWGTFASGVVQFSWLVWSCRQAGVGLNFVRPRLTPEVRLLVKRIVPGAVGAGVYQVNLVINTMIASTVADGAVSYLNYADRVNQLPLGVVGIAIGTALLPLLSRQIKSGQAQAALDSQNRALEFGLLLTIPAAVAFMVIALPVVSLLFERGSFTAEDSVETARALQAFAIGLPAYVLVKVLTPAFFAREDTATPVRVAAVTMIINIVLNLVLVASMRHVGMAISTAVAAWCNVMMLVIILFRRGYFTPDTRFLKRAPKIMIAGAVMGLALHQAQQTLWSPGMGGMVNLTLVGGLVGLGLLVFAGTAQLTGAAVFSEIKTIMRKKS